MPDQFTGEVRLTSFNYAPAGWMLCDGATLLIQQYGALFAELGTTYGGDGASTFMLPDLRHRIVVGSGQGASLSPYEPGQAGGAASATLSAAQVAGHAHIPKAAALNDGSISPANAYWSSKSAQDGTRLMGYNSDPAPAPLSDAVVGSAGSPRPVPFSIMQPFLVLNYIICLMADGPAPAVGEIRLFAGATQPDGWLPCDGRTLPVASYPTLAAALGSTYGGDGTTTVGLPELTSRVAQGPGAGLARGAKTGAESVLLGPNQVPTHTHSVNACTALADTALPTNLSTFGELFTIGTTGSPGFSQTAAVQMAPNCMASATATPVPLLQPFLSMQYLLFTGGGAPQAPAPWLGEIRPTAASTIPPGWHACDGSLLSVSQYSNLFRLVGTQFGGDSRVAFALPDLGGRVPMGMGPGSPIGAKAGSSAVTLTAAQMPAHQHTLLASSLPGTSAKPTNSVWAVASSTQGEAFNTYSVQAPNVTMAHDALLPAGSGAPVPISQPLQVVTFIISLTGLFPPHA